MFRCPAFTDSVSTQFRTYEATIENGVIADQTGCSHTPALFAATSQPPPLLRALVFRISRFDALKGRGEVLLFGYVDVRRTH